mmetsp:Transcript_78000/g.143265  ORF Transcript_78000/g.143265 Transcript_78000/m.143265 type:complete len:330 (-) Transcript_78000:47-1036(-)
MGTLAFVLLFLASKGEEIRNSREVDSEGTWYDKLGNRQHLKSNRPLKESNLLQPLTLLLLTSNPTTAFNPFNAGVRATNHQRARSAISGWHLGPAMGLGREDLSSRWISQLSAPAAKDARRRGSIQMEEEPVYAQTDAMSRQLRPDFLWDVRIDFSRPGTVAPVSIRAKIRFAPFVGRSPPQGLVRVEECVPEVLKLGEMPGRWILSEDPADREAGLNVLILLSGKPLLPYLLFSLELENSIKLGNETVPSGKLFFQVDHRRYYDGVQLGNGQMVFRIAETMDADLLGLAQATIDEDVPCGTITFLDTVDKVESGLLPRAETKKWWPFR